MLLDTHALLWFLSDDANLPPKIKQEIEIAESAFTSIVSLWEIGIKLSINKLSLEFEFSELPTILEQLEISVLPLTFNDIQRYISLPLHHRDPFDRMLIAQAIEKSLQITSADAAFDAYPIQRIWA